MIDDAMVARPRAQKLTLKHWGMDFTKFFGTLCSVMGILFLQVFISRTVEEYFGKSAISSSIGFGWFFVLHILVFVSAVYTAYRFWGWLGTKLFAQRFLVMSTEGIRVQRKYRRREILWTNLQAITTNSLTAMARSSAGSSEAGPGLEVAGEALAALTNDNWYLAFHGENGTNIFIKGGEFVSAPAAEKCIRIWAREQWGEELGPFTQDQQLRRQAGC